MSGIIPSIPLGFDPNFIGLLYFSSTPLVLIWVVALGDINLQQEYKELQDLFLINPKNPSLYLQTK